MVLYHYTVAQLVCLVQGGHILVQSVSDWPQIGQIRDFFGSYFSAFWLREANALKSDLKKVTYLSQFGANLTHFGPKFSHPGLSYMLKCSQIVSLTRDFVIDEIDH